MKHIFLVALLMYAVMILGFVGCAGSRPKSDTDIAQTPPPLNEPGDASKRSSDAAPPEPLSGTSEGTNDDEAQWADDDLDWTDDNSEVIYTVPDPLEKFNRAMFALNDKLYFWLMKPTAVGYRAVLPTPARTGIKNFFYNATAPVRIVNNILQGKGQAAEAEWARFLYNTTVGVLGIGDPAQKYPKLNPPEEDLGLTLAVRGVGDGFYLFLPFLGPSTLRDTAGFVGDLFLNPFAYAKPTEVSLGAGALNQLNLLSFRIGDYESLKKAALDPYEAFRNIYIQLRQSEIKK